MNRNKEHTKLVSDVLVELNNGTHDLACWPSPNGHAVQWSAKSGRVTHHHLGLPTGVADIVGLMTFAGPGVIGQEHKLGVWIELEAKTGRGVASEEQLRRQSLVRMYGGRYGIVRSVDSAVEIVRLWRAEIGQTIRTIGRATP